MKSRRGSTYQKIFELARPFLQIRCNLVHTRIARRYALKLIEREGGDEEVIIPAILLHDVGWMAIPASLHLQAFGPKATNPKLMKIHEREGAKIAKAILETMGYPKEKTEEICRIIRGHDSRKRPLSLNDRIVKDADKLWRYSARGVAIDANRFNLSQPAWLAYLEQAIGRWFLTDSAKEMARREIARRKKGLSGARPRALDRPCLKGGDPR
ncbi:MAG: HD domain-containing protein [Desulfobacterota bacterium]|nr:HD domain-containing protein [Thermodesulfobacteriota bacterium]